MLGVFLAPYDLMYLKAKYQLCTDSSVLPLGKLNVQQRLKPSPSVSEWGAGTISFSPPR